MSKRLDSLHAILLNNTVLSDWFLPMQKALDKVRYSRQQFSVLSAEFFILLGCLRQLQGTKILREQIQSLFDLDEKAETVPLAWSTWSDALASTTRTKILREAGSRYCLRRPSRPAYVPLRHTIVNSALAT